jgi:hypothetical protein
MEVIKIANAVQKSPYYNEIEVKIMDGMPDRKISEWLLKEHGEKIDHVTIFNHRKSFLNVDEEVNEEYLKNKRLKTKVKKRLNDLAYCDMIIDAAAKLGIEIDPDQKFTALDLHKLALLAIDKKTKLLADSPKRINNTNIIIPTDQKIRAKGRALVTQFIKPEE